MIDNIYDYIKYILVFFNILKKKDIKIRYIKFLKNLLNATYYESGEYVHLDVCAKNILIAKKKKILSLETLITRN